MPPAANRAVARAEIDPAGQPLDVERAVARSGLQIGLRRHVDDEARAAPAERPVEGVLGLLARRQPDAVAVLIDVDLDAVDTRLRAGAAFDDDQHLGTIPGPDLHGPIEGR